MHAPMARPIYLIVFHSPIFPAHWAMWIPQFVEGAVGNTGKTVNVQGSPSEGFVHEIDRNYDLTLETRRYSTIFLCNILSSMVVDSEEEYGGQDEPIDDLEKAALAIEAPAPSLRNASKSSRTRV